MPKKLEKVPSFLWLARRQPVLADGDLARMTNELVSLQASLLQYTLSNPQ